LFDKKVIGVNNAFKFGSWVDVCWFGDLKWWNWHQEELFNFPGLVMTCNENAELKGEPWLKKLRRARIPKSQGIVTTPAQVCWNACSGNSAINLAVLFGVKKIVLLGFDMKFIGEKEDKNWHDAHKESKHDPFRRFINVHKLIAEDAQKLGVEIINTSLESALNVYPKKRLEEVI
jgi:hypothetical protein